MEISNVVRDPYFFLLPIGFVIVCVVLVFVFGFRSSYEPNFSGLSDRILSDDRRPKKKRSKEKKFSGTNILSTASNESLETKEIEPANTSGFTKKPEDAKKDKRGPGENGKTKRPPRENEEKPVDYDEGEWETACSRKDKKNKKKETGKVIPPTRKKKESIISKDYKKVTPKERERDKNKDKNKVDKDKEKEMEPEKEKEKEKEKDKEKEKERLLKANTSSTSLMAVTSIEKLGRGHYSTHTLPGLMPQGNILAIQPDMHLENFPRSLK